MSTARRSFRLGGATGAEALEVRRDGAALRVAVGERVFACEVVPVAEGECDLVFSDGRRRRIRYSRRGDERWVSVGAQTMVAGVVHPRRERTGGGHDGDLTTPMPGRVVSVDAVVGSRVDKGAVLVRVEAMKMEHAIRAPYAGVVLAVRCAVGEQVDRGTALVELEPVGEGSS